MESLGVKARNLPHFKGLIDAKVELESQGHDSFFTICHTLLKKAILHHKMALGPFLLHRTVNKNEVNLFQDREKGFRASFKQNFQCNQSFSEYMDRTISCDKK